MLWTAESIFFRLGEPHMYACGRIVCLTLSSLGCGRAVVTRDRTRDRRTDICNANVFPTVSERVCLFSPFSRPPRATSSRTTRHSVASIDGRRASVATRERRPPASPRGRAGAGNDHVKSRSCYLHLLPNTKIQIISNRETGSGPFAPT